MIDGRSSDQRKEGLRHRTTVAEMMTNQEVFGRIGSVESLVLVGQG